MANADAIDIRQQITGDGAILFDAACAAQAGAFEADWFEPQYWRSQGLATDESGGRGGITFVRTPPGNKDGGGWVLRHYRRGGMVARVMGDRYLWNGAEQTRSFAEFRLLAELARRGLDVPRPVAARYRRNGVHYRADLITAQISDAQTLARRASAGTLDAAIAQRVGSAIARLHASGVYHADLNAHNLLLDPRTVWIIDFDRGELREPQRAWQLANLARLKRSLLKLGAAGDGDQGDRVFEQEIWHPLMSAYERSFDTTAAKIAGAR
jgi:3-deoxy-D-manno-octulosonic acid kinase